MTASDLPRPSPEAEAHSAQLTAHIREQIDRAGGWIDFAQYMALALYAPGLGYYSAGSRKLGAEGDFTTAPEMTPLFGQTLAQFCVPFIEAGLGDVLEVGAGSGALAATMLEEFARVDRVPASYQILELSADLRQRSRDAIAARVPQLLERVVWLNQLPPAFEGVILGNEVLDAMPVHVLRTGASRVDELGVEWDEKLGRFQWRDRPAMTSLATPITRFDLAPGYITELGLAAQGFIRSAGAVLQRGAMLFIDYGFPAREFFHPERRAGTLRCHYRHRAHDDPFLWPGLQDITAHVDFSAIAAAGRETGLTLAGYTSQAGFLIDCGLTGLLARVSPEDTLRYLPMSNAVQRLVSPAEMGELFKAIAFTRGWDAPLAGFARSDRSAAL